MATAVFKDCAFIVTLGIIDPTRQMVISAIHRGGGVVAGLDDASSVRRVSSASWFEIQGHGQGCSKDYDEVTWQLILERHGVSVTPQVVSTHWVHSSLAARHKLDIATNPLLKPLQCRVPLPSFENIKFCISTYKGSEKKLLRNLCCVLGAKCFEELSRIVTHLICPYSAGTKFESASSWGAVCVTKEWLFDCIEADDCIPTHNYSPPPADPDVVVPSQGVQVGPRRSRPSASDHSTVIDPTTAVGSTHPCSKRVSSDARGPERSYLQQTEAGDTDDIGSCFLPLAMKKKLRSSQDNYQCQASSSPSLAANLHSGRPLESTATAAAGRSADPFPRPAIPEEEKGSMKEDRTEKLTEESSRVVAAIENIMAKTAQAKKAAPATCGMSSLTAGYMLKGEASSFVPAFGASPDLSAFLPTSTKGLADFDNCVKAEGDDLFSPTQAQSQAIGYRDESYKKQQFVQAVKEQLRQKQMGAAGNRHG